MCRAARIDVNKLPRAHYQSAVCNSIIAGRWAMSGFPTVTLGHRTVAAFMATKIRPADAVSFVRAPWPAFGIRIPPDILTVEDNGVLREASFIAATAVDPALLPRETDRLDQERWWYKVMAPSKAAIPDNLPIYASACFNGMSLWAFNLPTESLAAADGGAATETDFERWDTHPLQGSDQRSEHLARAVIIAACLYLGGDPRELANRKSDGGVTITSRTSKQRDSDIMPPYTDYEVHSSIKINLHHAMRDFVRHGGSAPSVQTLAAGHWKRVAYGAAHSLRRLQHIAPYWRGPIDAPVSVRVK
jgi:hypothetical protein